MIRKNRATGMFRKMIRTIAAQYQLRTTQRIARAPAGCRQPHRLKPVLPGGRDAGLVAQASACASRCRPQRSKHIRDGRIVAKRLADVHETIHIPRPKNKTGAELKRILAQFMLVVSRRIGAFSGDGILASQQMKQRGLLQFSRAIGFHLRIHEQRERDARLFAENPRIAHITKPDRREICAARLDFLLVLAQLRDVLAAEHSAVMAQKHDHRRAIRPERAKPHGPLARVGPDGRIRQNDRR